MAKPFKDSAPIRPFLRWAGSKRQILPVLQAYWKPTHKRYVEPFAGSACLFFRIQPPKALLGDLNEELIATYLEVKYHPANVIRELDKLKKGETEFFRLRSLDVNCLNRTERAARFIYLNRFCFNGLYRTNAKGQFNVPYGGDRAGELPPSQVIQKCSTLLRRAHLRAWDFELVLDKARAGDFVYLDPPFSVEERRVFKEYNSKTFNTEDLERLRTKLEVLAQKDIDFLVSYADSHEANILRKGFRSTKIEVQRNISGFASGRCRATELLISSKPLT